MAPPLRSRWRAEVYRSPHISDAVRVLLLLMSDYMDERGYVSVPRVELARALGRGQRRIDGRLRDAVDAGFIDRVSRGHKGRTAVYRATLPTAHSAPPVQRAMGGAKGAWEQRAMSRDSAPPGGRTSSSTDPAVATDRRHVGSEGEQWGEGSSHETDGQLGDSPSPPRTTYGAEVEGTGEAA